MEIRAFTPWNELAAESCRQSWTRRQFLSRAAGSALFSGAVALKPQRLFASSNAKRKVVIVTFGGGARDDETFSAAGQENIPHLLKELAPQSTFFTQVVNRGILGHYVATASIATGVYETFDNFVSQNPLNPTIFECFRRDLRRPPHDACVIAPSNGFGGVGMSRNPRYGANYGAEVILPKELLTLAAGSKNHTLGDYENLLRDSYEVPASAVASNDLGEIGLNRLNSILKLSVDQFVAHARTLDSADELSLYIAHHVMSVMAPSLLFITLHDIDIAHSGAFSLYIDGIQRTDRLCAQLWQEIESNPEYKNMTTMFILPDFGRDADGDPGGNGFQHHRTGSPKARTTWMMALGNGARSGRIVDRPIESIDLAPTVGQILGFETPFTGGRPIVELI